VNPSPPLKNPKNPRPYWRMNDWLLAAIALSFAVWWIAPQQLPVSLYKLSLVALAAVAGYWIDRSLFPYARPDVFLALETECNRFPPLEPLVPAPSSTGDSQHCIGLQALPDGSLLRMVGMCMLRRAIIVAATMLAVGLGA